MEPNDNDAVKTFAEREAEREAQKARRSPLRSKQQTLAQVLRFLTMASGQLGPLLREVGSHNKRVDPEFRLHEMQTDLRALNAFVSQKLSNAKYQMELMKHEAILRDMQKEKQKEEK